MTNDLPQTQPKLPLWWRLKKFCEAFDKNHYYFSFEKTFSVSQHKEIHYFPLEHFIWNYIIWQCLNDKDRKLVLEKTKEHNYDCFYDYDKTADQENLEKLIVAFAEKYCSLKPDSSADEELLKFVKQFPWDKNNYHSNPHSDRGRLINKIFNNGVLISDDILNSEEHISFGACIFPSGLVIESNVEIPKVKCQSLSFADSIFFNYVLVRNISINAIFIYRLTIYIKDSALISTNGIHIWESKINYLKLFDNFCNINIIGQSDNKNEVNSLELNFLRDFQIEVKNTDIGLYSIDENSTSFGKNISFIDCSFLSAIDFTELYTKNLPQCNFSDSTFKGKVNFSGMTFESDAIFHGVTFEQGAIFNSAVFKGRTSFKKAKFKDEASFYKAEFSAFCNEQFFLIPSFISCKFEEIVDFREASFPSPPHFEGAEMEILLLNGAKFSNNFAKNEQNEYIIKLDVASSAWAALVRLTEKLHNWEWRLKFHNLSLKVDEKLLQTLPELEKQRQHRLFYRLYDLFGKGEDSLRPLFFMGLFAYVFGYMLFSLYFISSGEIYKSLRLAVLVVMDSVFPIKIFAPTALDSLMFELKLPLFAKIITLIARIMLFLISYISIFMAGLSLRNRFRMKS